MTDWRDRQLHFVQAVRGERRKHANAREALEHSVIHPMMDEPPVGALVWWDDTWAGNVALWIGNQMVLGISPETGHPVVTPVQRISEAKPIGWSHAIGDADE